MTTMGVRALIAKNDPWHSSCRSVEEVAGIFKKANEIWRQAEIEFDVRILEHKFDSAVLEEIVQAAFQRKGGCARLAEVTGSAPKEITAVYVHSIGGSSGKVFRPNRTIVVVDDTKVSAARTTAHEIGHIFDLEHWLDHPPPEPADRPPNQLMARTQLGTDLIARDIQKVRESLPLMA